MSRLICPMCLTGVDHLRNPAEIEDPMTGCLAPTEGDGIMPQETIEIIIDRHLAILHDVGDTWTGTKCGQLGYSTGVDEQVTCRECLGFIVSAYVSDMDGTTVLQVDTSDGGRIRINLNDAPIWDGDPNTDERPGAHFKED